ncbi:MAG: cation transporter [Armatimonadota bacterium]
MSEDVKLSDERRRFLRHRALVVSYVNLAYNVAEGVVTIWAGVLAGSVALVGFGLDSAIESLSSLVMIWRFRGAQDLDKAEISRREKRAVRFVAYTFYVLAAYVIYEALETVYLQEPPDPSMVGIVVAAISLLTMPVLAYYKRTIGEALGSRSLVADATETLACAWLSAALLIGLGLNYLWGLWWADPLVGAVVALFLVHEAHELLEGEEEADEG